MANPVSRATDATGSVLEFISGSDNDNSNMYIANISLELEIERRSFDVTTTQQSAIWLPNYFGGVLESVELYGLVRIRGQGIADPSFRSSGTVIPSTILNFPFRLTWPPPPGLSTGAAILGSGSLKNVVYSGRESDLLRISYELSPTTFLTWSQAS
jgi:hypothetical protein